METALANILVTVCEPLAKHGVRYLIVGGTAVALHGYYRHSVFADGTLATKPDLDIWYDPTYANYFALLRAIRELGRDTTAFETEQMPNPRKSFFKLDFAEFALDLLPEIKAPIKFAEANSRKETAELRGIQIHFIGYADLVEDKTATARAKDVADVEQLKKLRGEA